MSAVPVPTHMSVNGRQERPAARNGNQSTEKLLASLLSSC